MVSDSQASESDKTKYAVPKIWEDGGLLFGYSGNTAVLHPVRLAIHNRLESLDAGDSRWTVGSELCAAIRPVLESEYGKLPPCAA